MMVPALAPGGKSPVIAGAPRELGHNLHNVSASDAKAWWLADTGAPETPEPERHTPKLRRLLYRLSEAYREHAIAPRVAKCARVRCDRQVAIPLHTREGKQAASFQGLIKCRSKACPVCLAVRRSKYAEEILRVAKLWTDDHRSGRTATYLATFTIRHGTGDDLTTIGHGVRACWRKFLSGRTWQALRLQYGFEYIAAEELTHGANGWHPHMHVLFLPTRRLTMDEVLNLSGEFYERWASIVERELGPAFVPNDVHGADFRPCASQDYITKAVGLELADPGTKRGKKGGRSPVQLLAAFEDKGDEQALGLYREYERVMRGRRDLTWSKGLRSYREQACLELKDEARAVAATAQTVAVFPPDIWDKWRRTRDAHSRVLEAAEGEGLEGVARVVAAELGAWAADLVRKQTARTLRQLESVKEREALQAVSESRGPPGAFGWLSPF